VVLPVLLLIIVGIVAFGRYMNYANQEQQMAAQGARLAAVAYDPTGAVTLDSYIVSQALGGLGTQSGDVTSAVQAFVYYPTGQTCSPSACNVAGNQIRACAVATVSLLPIIGGGSLKLVQTATMRVETALPTSSPPWSVDSNVAGQPAAAAGCPMS
jgi:Flp pilus assembly protein TadG